MKLFIWKSISVILTVIYISFSCSSKKTNQDILTPKEIIDLGALVTEDLPERVWGKAFMAAMRYDKSNHFEVIDWEFEMENGRISGSNAYYTLFNHGGPHVDAPNHINLGKGLNSYPIESFMGPLKVFDVSQFPIGRTVPVEVFKDKILPGDIVLIYTKYSPSQSDEDFPETITLSSMATEYLARIPVRAFGTDAFSVGSFDNNDPVDSDSETARVAPIHYAFLSLQIPVYEQLFQVEKLLEKQNMYFIGVPLNIKDGDGMLVRPVVFVF